MDVPLALENSLPKTMDASMNKIKLDPFSHFDTGIDR